MEWNWSEIIRIIQIMLGLKRMVQTSPNILVINNGKILSLQNYFYISGIREGSQVLWHKHIPALKNIDVLRLFSIFFRKTFQELFPFLCKVSGRKMVGIGSQV